jgi:hypothetical protein
MNFLRVTNLLLVLSLTQMMEERSQAATDEEIAVALFPIELKTRIERKFRRKPISLRDFVAFERADLDGVGRSNYLVCVYTNRNDGILRVINTDGPAPSPIAQSQKQLLYGVRGGPTLLDLDKDKKPEIAVSFSSSRGNPTTWIFRWTGAAIQLVSPLTQDGHSALGSVSFLDLAGDGTLSVVTEQPTVPTKDDDGNILHVPDSSYVLVPDGLRETGSFIFASEFVRKAGSPVEQIDSFKSEDPTKTYTIQVFDLNMSKPDLGPLVSSAELYLNGMQIVGPSAFKPGSRTKKISVTTQLKSTNDLKIKLNGAPGEKVLVTVSESKK